MGTYMAAEGLVPDWVLISPSVRTQETWKFTVPALKSTVEAVIAEQLYDATPDAIIDVIKRAPAMAHTLLVIAHNPGLQELALMLIASGNAGARGRLKEKLPTAGLVIIDFAFDDWSKLQRQTGRLERFASPKSL
jgi:phosphohistidine phosphatase